jgi:hypothetical protein
MRPAKISTNVSLNVHDEDYYYDQEQKFKGSNVLYHVLTLIHLQNMDGRQQWLVRMLQLYCEIVRRRIHAQRRSIPRFHREFIASKSFSI